MSFFAATKKEIFIPSNIWKVGYYRIGLCDKTKHIKLSTILEISRENEIWKLRTDLSRRWSRVSWRATWQASAATATSRGRGNYVAAPFHAVLHSRFKSNSAKLHLLSESCVKCVAMCWVSCLSYKKKLRQAERGETMRLRLSMQSHIQGFTQNFKKVEVQQAERGETMWLRLPMQSHL